MHTGAYAARQASTPHVRGNENDLDAPTVKRIRSAFADGQGGGLFHLGAVEATTALPPVLAFWRDLGCVFMTAVCAVPDLDARRDKLGIPIPSDALPTLIEAAPPMLGGEYLCIEALENLWTDMEAAFGSQLQTFRGSVPGVPASEESPLEIGWPRALPPRRAEAQPGHSVCFPGNLHNPSGQTQQGSTPAPRQGFAAVRGGTEQAGPAWAAQTRA